MAALDAMNPRGSGRGRAAVSRERVRRAAGTALSQLEAALGEGDSKKARELTGVLREMLQLHRELQGGAGQQVTVCFVGETDTAAR